MPKKKKTHDVLLTPDQALEIKRDIADLDRMLENDKKSGRNLITDKALFNSQIAGKKKILKDHTPKKFRSTADKNSAYARAKELRKLISDAMPSREAYFRPYPGRNKPVNSDFDFERTVRQQMELQKDKNFNAAVSEYKNIMRRLDPSDPTITNIEMLRR